eukprot:3740743-Lingulodinium_polyedra.AAC.1
MGIMLAIQQTATIEPARITDNQSTGAIAHLRRTRARPRTTNGKTHDQMVDFFAMQCAQLLLTPRLNKTRAMQVNLT